MRRTVVEVATIERPCVVCGTATAHRTTTFKPDGRRVHYRTYRCPDFDACAHRRRTGAA